MMAPLVWIIDEEWQDYAIEEEVLSKKYPACTIKYSSYDYMQDLEEFGFQADFILCQIYATLPEKVIRKLTKCKGIAVYGGGYDRVDTAAARKLNIGVTNVSNYCKEDVADHVIAAIYHFNKRLSSYDKAMQDGLWGAQAVQNKIRRIQGSTLLIIGLGRIGRTVAEKGGALGMNVIAFDPYVDEKTMQSLGIDKVSWNEGLERADFISLSPILTSETENLLSYGDFKKMKKSAYLINTARGKIIVEHDLVRAVREGLIAGAALDVIATEPPTFKEDVFSCPDIIVTPHISYISEESYAELKSRTLQNALDMFEGRTPVDLVN
ncbi:MAG: C-terminal binding protein [Desulfocapsaceae bacterium]